MNPSNCVKSVSEGDNLPAFTYLNGIQVTESESHPDWISRSKRKSFKDSGGPFSSDKTYCLPSPGARQSMFRIETTYPLWFYPAWAITESVSYDGPFMPLSPNLVEFPASAASSEEDLDTLGATAIARCSPSNPSTDLTVAIGEIFHEGIPSLIGGTLQKWRNLSARERRRSIGNEYLNVEFGWKPLINDLRKTAESIVTADLILNQYKRDSGKLVRRGYDFPLFTAHDVQPSYTDVSPWVSPGSSFLTKNDTVNKGKVIRTQDVTIRRWFRGAFTYYVPPSDTLRNSIAYHVIQARKLLGISLTPDSLWNLAPWSWAVDWFFNVGDVLSNWTDWAIDNQVLVYGYMMEHSINKYTYTFTGPTGYYTEAMPSDLVVIREVKQRRQATPYGFGLSFDGFTDRQKTIIAALGISRSK